MGHVPLFSSERLRFCPSSGIYSFLIFSFFVGSAVAFFHCIGCSCIDVTLFWLSLTLLVRLLTFSLLSFCAVVVVCRRVDTDVRFVLWWCGLLLFLFLGVFGDVVLLFCMSYGLMCCSFVDGCVASVVFIRCIPDLGVGVSSSVVLFSVVLFLIMLLGVVLFFCCFYLLRMSSLISLMFFFFFFLSGFLGSSFWCDGVCFLIFGGECFLSFCLFGFGPLFFFWIRYSCWPTGAGGAGNCFSRFPRLGMPSGVTLVNWKYRTPRSDC